MNRLRNLVSWGILGMALNGMAATSALAGEWVSLFDGQTLSGWTQGGGQGKSKWEVEDGAITGSGQASMLYSPKGEYKNFKFRAEVKISDHGNSGMYFRCPRPNGSFSEGYEAQIDSTHRDPIRTGSVYGFVHVYKQIVPPDTWFTYEVEVVDKDWRGKKVPHIKVSINGEVLYELIEYTKAWDHGHFAFQHHDPGSKVHIRKIEVMELDEKGK
ncbi:MAG: DUF1080 domain-containing protein [Isosphaeraceae bacterium]